VTSCVALTVLSMYLLGSVGLFSSIDTYKFNKMNQQIVNLK